MDSKNAAREYLLAAEKYIKDSLFEEARREVKKAQEIDSSNIYTFAFLERIEFFSQQKEKENGQPTAEEPPDTDIPDPLAEPQKMDLSDLESFTEEEDETETISPPEPEAEEIEPVEDYRASAPSRAFDFDDLKTLDKQQTEQESGSEGNRSAEETDDEPAAKPPHRETGQTDNLISRIETLERRLNAISLSDAGDDASLAGGTAVALKLSDLEDKLNSFQTVYRSETSDIHSKLSREEESIRSQLDEFAGQLDSINRDLLADGSTPSDPSRLNDIQDKLNSLQASLESIEHSRLNDKIRELEEKIYAIDAVKPSLELSDPKNARELINHIAHLEKRINDYSVALQSETMTVERIDELALQIEDLQKHFSNLVSTPGKEPAGEAVPSSLLEKIDAFSSQIEELSGRISSRESTAQSEDELSGAYNDLEAKYAELARTVDEITRSQPQTGMSVPDVSGIEERLVSLQQAIDDLNERTGHSERITRESGDVYEQILEGTRNLRAEVEAYRNEHQSLLASIEAAGRKDSGEKIAKHEIDGLRDELRKLVETTEKLQDTGISREEFTGRLTSLEERLEALAAEGKRDDRMSEEISSVEQRLEALGSRISQFTGDLDLIRERVDENAKLVDRFTVAESQLTELNKKLEDTSGLKDRQEYLEKEYVAVVTRLNEVRDLFEAGQTTREDIESVNLRLQEINRRVQELGTSVESEEEQHNRYDFLSKSVSELSGELTNIRSVVQAQRDSQPNTGNIDNRFDRLEKRIDELGPVPSFAAELRDKLEGAEHRIEEVNSALDGIRSRLDSEISEIRNSTELTAKLAHLEQETGGLRAGIDEMHRRFEEERAARLDAHETEEKLSQLRNELGELRSSLSFENDLREKISATEKRNDQLGGLLAELQQRTDAALEIRPEREQIDARFSALQNDLSRLHAALGFENELRDKIGATEQKSGELGDAITELRRLIEAGLAVRPDSGELETKLNGMHSRIDEIFGKIGFEDELRNLLHALEERIAADRGESLEKIETFFGILQDLKNIVENEKSRRQTAERGTGERIGSLEREISGITAILEKLEELASSRNQKNDKRYEDLLGRIGELQSSFDREQKSREAFVHLEQRFEEARMTFDEDRISFEHNITGLNAAVSDLKTTLEEERRQRELIQERQSEVGKRHFAAALEKAWLNGMPNEEDTEEIRRLADLFMISPDDSATLQRDVKRRMYTLAAKAAIADQKVLKDPSISLDGLRKKYGVTFEEYIEFESNFLHDIASHRYNGTVLFVSGNAEFRTDLSDRLKSVGFAVAALGAPDNALEKIDMLNPHIIVSDLDFPDTRHSGLNLLNVLRKNPRYEHVPFIIIAEPQQVSRVQSALYRPNESIVAKPVELNALMPIIDKQLSLLREHIMSRHV